MTEPVDSRQQMQHAEGHQTEAATPETSGERTPCAVVWKDGKEYLFY